MSYRDLKILTDKDDKPIPQRLNISENRFEPETEETVNKVEVTNQNKSVNEELESIKATQQAILDRLDEPLPTQVTGSNVEKEILVIDKVLVTAGSDHRAQRIADVAGEFISAYIYFHGGEIKDFDLLCMIGNDINIRVTSPGRAPILMNQANIDYDQNGVGFTESRIPVVSRDIQPRFINNSDEDVEVSVGVFQWKNEVT